MASSSSSPKSSAAPLPSALMSNEATSSPSSSLSPIATPLPGDASFGLDPSADVDHHLEGHTWLPSVMPDVLKAPSNSGKDDTKQGMAASVSSLLGLRTTSIGGRGMREERQRSRSTGRRSSIASSSTRNEPTTTVSKVKINATSPLSADYAGGSVTSSLLYSAPGSPSISSTRRLSLLLSSMTINLVLPFLNGVMLGTGEIVARAIVVPGLMAVGVRIWRSGIFGRGES